MVTQIEQAETYDRLRQWFDLHGRPQLRLADLGADGVEGGWVRYARCGPGQPDAVHPEAFHTRDADEPATYRAQRLCVDCPVRRICDTVGTEREYPGVWGGIWRSARGRAAPLCSTPRCMNYRMTNRNSVDLKLCRDCLILLATPKTDAAKWVRSATERAAKAPEPVAA